MSYQGDVRLGETIGWKFTTRQASGVPTTLAGSPVLSAYAAGSNSPITAGITLNVDYPKTGLNDVTIVASSGNGYATATNYDVVITTGTVNSVSVVGEVIGSFSIANRSALMPTTAGRTAVVDAAGLIDANAVKIGPSGSGTAQTAGDVGIKTGFALTPAYDAAKTASQVVATDIVSGGAITTSGGIASSDVKKVNAVTVNGVGTAGSPWGP